MNRREVLLAAAEEAEDRSMRGAFFPEWATTARLLRVMADEWGD